MVVIDFSQIAALGMLKDPEFLCRFEILSQRLSDDSEIEAVCIHEAAHVIYLEELNVTTFQYHWPRITYDLAERKYVTEGAAVSGDIPQITTRTAEEKARLLIRVSRYFAAGGVARLKLTLRKDAGDTKDFQDFQERLRLLRIPGYDDPVKLSAAALDLWERAKVGITQDLENEACRIKMRIQNKAKEIRPFLFQDVPLVALPTGDPRAFS